MRADIESDMSRRFVARLLSMSQLIVSPVWTKSLPRGMTVVGTIFVVASFVGMVFSSVSTVRFPEPEDLIVSFVPITLT